MSNKNTNGDKSLLITGCSSGIGLCVAKGLKVRGFRVFATARKKEDVRALNELELESIQLDLADSHSISTAVEEVLSRTNGRLYGLFSNGAYGQPGAVEDLRRDVLRAQFETNFFGTVELMNQIIPVMRRQGYGRIVHTSSILGLVALPYRGAYTATKFALEGLTDTLRLELAGTPIHVSLIEPGPIETRFRENAYEAFKKYIDQENSPHRERYKIMEKRLTTVGPAMRFTLPPEKVLKKAIHALENPHPKIRYYVTFPTYAFATMKRVLPGSSLDRFFKWMYSGKG